MSTHNKKNLFSVFFTFAIDSLGATIVFPIFAPLFLDVDQGLFANDVSLQIKTTLLGFFLGIFPFMQFFFTPVLGEYSDIHGRKRALVFTTFLTFIGFAISAIGIQFGYINWLFIGRALSGIGAGNMSICLSTLSDLSSSAKKKRQYFSYGSAMAGMTFILGPLLGGKLSDPEIYPMFSPAFAMGVGAVFAFVNFLFIIFLFRETLKKRLHTTFSFLRGLKNIHLALRTKKLKNLYLIYFFYLFAWNIFFLFVPAFLVQNYESSNSTIGDISALMGVCWVLGTGVLHRLIPEGMATKKFLVGSCLLFAVFSIWIIYSTTLITLLILIGVCTVLSGYVWPMCTGAISDNAGEGMQGKVLGISQSMLSLTMMLAAIFGGLFLHNHSDVPFFLAGVSALIATVFTLRLKM